MDSKTIVELFSDGKYEILNKIFKKKSFSNKAIFIESILKIVLMGHVKVLEFIKFAPDHDLRARLTYACKDNRINLEKCIDVESRALFDRNTHNSLRCTSKYLAKYVDKNLTA